MLFQDWRIKLAPAIPGRIDWSITSPRHDQRPSRLPRPRLRACRQKLTTIMKINQLTVRQVANIVANENHDVTPGTSSPEELQNAKIMQAHTIINADRKYGPIRDQRAGTASKEVTPALENSPQYQQALSAARTAFQQQPFGYDPTGCRMHFNNRNNPSTGLHRIGRALVPPYGKPFGPFQLGSKPVYTDIYENPPE